MDNAAGRRELIVFAVVEKSLQLVFRLQGTVGGFVGVQIGKYNPCSGKMNEPASWAEVFSLAQVGIPVFRGQPDHLGQNLKGIHFLPETAIFLTIKKTETARAVGVEVMKFLPEGEGWLEGDHLAPKYGEAGGLCPASDVPKMFRARRNKRADLGRFGQVFRIVLTAGSPRDTSVFADCPRSSGG